MGAVAGVVSAFSCLRLDRFFRYWQGPRDVPAGGLLMNHADQAKFDAEH